MGIGKLMTVLVIATVLGLWYFGAPAWVHVVVVAAAISYELQQLRQDDK